MAGRDIHSSVLHSFMPREELPTLVGYRPSSKGQLQTPAVPYTSTPDIFPIGSGTTLMPPCHLLD